MPNNDFASQQQEFFSPRWILFGIAFPFVFRLILHFYWRSDCIAFRTAHPELGCAFGDGKLHAQTFLVSITPLAISLLAMALPKRSFAWTVCLGGLAAAVTFAVGLILMKYHLAIVAPYFLLPFVACVLVLGLDLSVRYFLSRGRRALAAE